MKAFLVLFAVVAMLANAGAHGAEDAVIRESNYNYIKVQRQGSLVTFSRVETEVYVSAIDMDDPARQVVTYTRYLFAPALLKPDPVNVLNIGMGAGAINRLFTRAFPEATMVSVEIDKMVVDIAREFTRYRESARDRLVIDDGRRYLKRTAQAWDWIIIDAFVRRSQIPAHLTTVEFYRLVASRLAPDGVLAINLHDNGALFLAQAATLLKVFPQVAFLKPPGGSSNVIALATLADADIHQRLGRTDPAWLPDLRKWEVDFAEMKTRVGRIKADSLPATVLTDDFAPVEFLDMK